MTNASSTSASFRVKAAFMKTWTPQNQPSNRDRLELFALHKQAVSGDAPPNPPSDASVSEKSKYTAWKSKRGLSPDEAMTQYISECDRQVRVYGSTPASSASTTAPQTPSNTPRTTANTNSSSSLPTPRGLAAIPLLCAATAESRVAYLRRMEVTTPETSWWCRQEPLCVVPNTPGAIPESILLRIASLVETFSLNPTIPIVPPSVLQSLLWPLHNMFLSVWMGLILLLLLCQSSWHVATTLVWGARRTGRPLATIWDVEITPTSRAVTSLCEPHQALSVRLVGLLLWPLSSIVVNGSTIFLPEASVGSSALLLVLLMATWWYWILVVPWIVMCLIGAAAMSGTCFAVIEFAGV